MRSTLHGGESKIETEERLGEHAAVLLNWSSVQWVPLRRSENRGRQRISAGRAVEELVGPMQISGGAPLPLKHKAPSWREGPSQGEMLGKSEG